ncbi:MAG: hypothetical protein E6G34_11350 [Actinobacteria bacterium]|nr:MAG: hypothetical protein E6G34_11350 [Actinomycetota bacterium]
MRRAKDEQGIALVATVLMLMVMSGIGLALLLFTNNQQKAASREQASESAFTVGEAALNSTVSQLSRKWPSESGEAVSTCTAGLTNSTNYCPDKTSLEAGYPNTSPATCPTGTPKDPWGSALSNEWTTYVRDDATGEVFNSTTEQGQLAYDANKDGKVWVRSVGVVRCRLVSVITLVARQQIAISFPHNVVTANWFETTNSGKKVIIDTEGEAGQSGNVSVRCESPHPEPCENYEKEKGQVSPDTTVQEAGTSPSLPSTTLKALREEAEASGHYYKTGSCPSGMPSGFPVYVEGPCEITGGNNEVVNSQSSPGFLVIANGTFSMGGTSKFYGVIYCLNQQKSTGAVVSLSGSAELIGAVDIDGGGGASFGSSGAPNITYSGKAIEELKAYAGAAATRNSFRVLPSNQ